MLTGVALRRTRIAFAGRVTLGAYTPAAGPNQPQAHQRCWGFPIVAAVIDAGGLSSRRCGVQLSMSDQDQQSQLPEPNQTRRTGGPQDERGSSGQSSGRSSGGGRQHGGGGSGGRGRHQPATPNQRRHPEASLNMEELRELVELFTSHGLTDFELENETIRVHLRRNLAPQASVAPSGLAVSAMPSNQAPAPPVVTNTAGAAQSGMPQGGPEANPATTPATTKPEASSVRARTEELYDITSPIVGTFYRSPSPTSEPFIRPGSAVEPDTVVCIIEAMKLMNEILAETTGVVEKIYVEDGQPVEYGQPLFGVKR
ncbi:MAG: acetyl-CoA carboxylase biotin carboxyl carrier protein [Pyrinomonadaceae bacterium]|nr:acetyl-CoA carboxylase biotin carboxyl carrier protein [Pyrinomonadaceae bacterium]